MAIYQILKTSSGTCDLKTIQSYDFFVCRCLFTVGILAGLLTKELQALQKAQAWFSPFLEILVAAFHF